MPRPSAAATPTRHPRASRRSRRASGSLPDMTENGGQGPYPYDPAKAEALLTAHGWQVVGGVLTCEAAGSNCGAGIAKGTQAKFSMAYTSGISTQADDVDILKSAPPWPASSSTCRRDVQHAAGRHRALQADQAAASGRSCTLGGWLFNGPGFEPTGEPLYQTGVPSNSGSYSDPTMDKLINATHTSNSLSAFDATPTTRRRRCRSLDARGYRDPGRQDRPAQRDAEPAAHVLPRVLDVQRQDLLTPVPQ